MGNHSWHFGRRYSNVFELVLLFRRDHDRILVYCEPERSNLDLRHYEKEPGYEKECGTNEDLHCEESGQPYIHRQGAFRLRPPIALDNAFNVRGGWFWNLQKIEDQRSDRNMLCLYVLGEEEAYKLYLDV